MKHSYTLSEDLPEMVQAKLNARNLSEVKARLFTRCAIRFSTLSPAPSSAAGRFQSSYKESWMKIRDGGYKLRLDAIPFQSAKSCSEILSDVSD